MEGPKGLGGSGRVLEGFGGSWRVLEGSEGLGGSGRVWEDLESPEGLGGSSRIFEGLVFFFCKYLICMERTRWVKTGLVSSCLDMLEQNILYQKALDLNIFGIQNILGDKNILWSKIFWTQNYFGIKIFLDPNFFVFIFLGTKI